MQFKIDIKIFIFLIVFYITGQLWLYAIILSFAVIHELGHLVTGILVGMKPTKMELNPYGVSISFSINANDYNKKILKANLLQIKKIIVASAGPITNLIIILITDKLNLGIFTEITIMYANLLLIIFNLLPIYPLDGGRILKSLLYIFTGKKKSEIYINIISFCTLLGISVIGAGLTFKSQNIAIMFIIIILWIMYIKEYIYYKNKKKIYKLMKKAIENSAN